MLVASIKSKLSKSDFLKKLVFGTFWMTFGSLMSRGLFSLASIVLARILTVSEYGEFGMIKSTIDNFLIFASLGIGLTATKYISELKDEDKSEASSMLGASLSLVVALSSIVALIIVLLSGFIATHFLNNQHLQVPLMIGGFTLIFISLNGTQMGALLGFQAYKKNSTANILQGLFLFLGLVIGGYFGGVTGALLGNLIGIFLVSAVLQKLLGDESKNQQVTVSFKNWKKSVKKIYKFAIPASLSTIIVAPTIWFLNTLLVNQPNGYKELGLYSAVIIFSTAIQMFNGAISNVLLPMFLSKSESKTPKKEFFNYFGSWIISIIISIPFILFPEIASAILGKKFDIHQIVPILGMSIITTLIITNRAGVSRDLIIKNKMWLSVFSMGQWAVTNLIIFYFLRQYGAMGFAFSYMISYIINYIIFVPFFIYKKLSPPVIFYSKWNILLWLLLLGLVFINVQLYSLLLIRIIVSVLLVVSILFSIFKLYKECLQKL
ncbi:oligosaccharide flippase family protein [Chryseobacterium rhizosphaerae]|uniref:oligosaccharide flippase family protein n=1 Tax=Chryseobacterium rhizosphaerae TaxID=395937 RepID=UPI0009DF33AF|nr:oligosaccharide flippase family protein [Chryseobacterium rhizosphaerae]MDC8099700.1 oligosaccharide flippase family protein [Chryseobacterium rhizosphaerae]